MNTYTIPSTSIACIYEPGRALFGACVLDLTQQAHERGLNLTGCTLAKACDSPESGGYWLEGTNEAKHYNAKGMLDN